MMAAILLDLDEVEFLEPSFDRLLDGTYTSMLACTRASEGHLLINEREEPIAAALKDEKGWKACSFTMRRPIDTLFDRLEQIDTEIYQEKQSEWEAAVREYFSLKMMKKVSPSVEDFSTDRKEKLRELVRETWRGEKKLPLPGCLLRERNGLNGSQDHRDATASFRQRPLLVVARSRSWEIVAGADDVDRCW